MNSLLAIVPKTEINCAKLRLWTAKNYFEHLGEQDIKQLRTLPQREIKERLRMARMWRNAAGYLGFIDDGFDHLGKEAIECLGLDIWRMYKEV